jgi:hypothetical protein
MHMSYLFRPIAVIGIFLASLMISLFMVGHSLIDIFSHNFLLNVLIVGIFAFGVGLCIWQLFKLRNSYIWIDTFEQQKYNPANMIEPDILHPVFTAFKRQASLDLFSLKTVLSSVEQRLEDQREFNRYIVGLCVFLGLVGTFWGLSKTISAIAGVINGIDINANDIKDAFHNLKTGLQAPLTGMGYAFSSSLFGLSASLVLGFIDMQVSKAISNFYNHVEEVLAPSVQSVSMQSKGHGAAYSGAMVEQLCENLSYFQQHLERTEENRTQMATFMQSFLGNLARLDDIMRQNLQHMESVSKRHLELQQQLSQFMQQQNSDKSLNSLKMIEMTLQNILGEVSKGQKISTEEIKKEIRLVSKTLSVLASDN